MGRLDGASVTVYGPGEAMETRRIALDHGDGTATLDDGRKVPVVPYESSSMVITGISASPTCTNGCMSDRGTACPDGACNRCCYTEHDHHEII